jgi:hypothetical protein
MVRSKEMMVAATAQSAPVVIPATESVAAAGEAAPVVVADG